MKTRSTFFSLAVMLVLLTSLVFQVTPSHALAGTYFTTIDNENNAHTGVADGDMDVETWNDFAFEPIEFNISVPVGGLPTTDAFLAIRAFDVDEEQGQKDEVFLNGTSLGFLSGTNGTWNTTAFAIPAGLLLEGNNLVNIEVDTLNPGFPSWYVIVDWGQIVVDGGIGTPGRINSITVTSFSDVGGTITLNVDVVVEALADGTFDLETNIYNPSGNSPAANLQAGFAMTAGQIVTKSIQFVFPAGTDGDVYTLRGFLFDTATGLLNSIKSNTWTYSTTPAPTITNIAPNAGPVAGGTTVIITGTDLTGGAFTFGGTTASCIVALDGLSATCTTPAHTAGAVDVVVTTPGGPATSAGGFTYMDPPTIGGIAPNSGPEAGGTSVVITGTNLTGGTVTFGGTAATCTVDSPTQITCTSPAHTPGAVDVVVTTPGGQTTSAGGFTYIPAPTIGGIAPNSGPTAGGTSVVITGTNLTGGTVTFGGTAATCTVNSPTQITCTSPAHAAGPVDVVVTTPGGPATSAGGFTYISQSITSITPNSGPTGGGTAVTIVGYGFTGATSIKFGGTAGVCTVVSDTQINCTTPAHATGAVDVVITAPLGTVTSPSGFTYIAPVFTLTASGAATVKPGDLYVYTFTYTTSAKAFNAQVVFSLPGHTTYVSNSGGYACATVSGVVTCNLGAISTNSSFTTTLQVDKLKKVNTPLTLQATTYAISDNGAAVINGAPTVTANTLTPFADVPAGHAAIDYIQSIWAYGITGGCVGSPLSYCPNINISRAEMAIYIERGIHTSAFNPGTPALTFTDTSTNPAKYWIEALKADGITGGCTPTTYCPTSSITRSQMSIFLLRGKYWPAVHVPPTATGLIFTDVPANSFAANWIEELKALGITSGCGPNIFCPNNPVTRSDMALFMQRTFNLPMPTP